MKKSDLKHWKNILLLILAIGLILIFFKECFWKKDGNEKIVTDLPTINDVKELKKEESKHGKDFWQMQHVPTTSISNSGIPAHKYDSIIRELGLKESQIKSMTIYSSTIKDSLKLAKLERDELNNKVWKWEKTLKSGSKIVRTMSEKDSVLKESTDLAVAVIDKTEGRGKNRKFYTIFYPLDDNVKFNGASVFRKENTEIRDILALSLGMEVRKDFFTPDAQVQADLNLKILPDGKFAPTAKVGGIYDTKNGVNLFYGVRVDYNFARIKKRN